MLTRAAMVAATATTVLTSAFLAGPGIALASMSVPADAPSMSAAPAAPHKCASGTQGTVGGASKCLSAGQQCQQAHASDYTKYGFTCGKVGQRYQLSKGNQARSAVNRTGKSAKPAKPAAAKSSTSTRH